MNAGIKNRLFGLLGVVAGTLIIGKALAGLFKARMPKDTRTVEKIVLKRPNRTNADLRRVS